MRIPTSVGDARDAVALRLARRDHEKTLRTVEDGPWRSFEGLTRYSTVLAGIRPRHGTEPFVNVLLPEIGPSSYFAGVRTALLVAAMTAKGLGRALRVISFGPLPRSGDEKWLAGAVASDLGTPLPAVELYSVWHVARESFSTDDVWFATYWTTAHALDVAARSGLLDPARVVYLLQDYEAGFYPGSTVSAVVQSTYHAGFVPLVNSRPVATTLERRAGLMVPSEQIFAPQIDLTRLEAASGLRTPDGPLRVGFYGRPSKPRNAFALGVAALRSASARLKGPPDTVEFWSIGEKHNDAVLPGGRRLRSIGKVSWAGYFEQLAGFDVLLSLQQSPHPSHPPLDMATLGGFAVMNDLEGTRSQLSPRLIARANDPDALAGGLVDVLANPALREARSFDPSLIDVLGVPLDRAVHAVLQTLP
ncbi:hypothetical protein GRS96_14135 [Rathayibacter sp. VKM Ac-2803]|uniref:rhamnosyltransferase WsaF family glycosyltransferase n=1 Tax=Rathayibacter sp. VKM Ac-2803 TaxID=2609256 RepID=UPI0013584A4E|nr:hypothetical protein [Rathayibacter sp. VKM Ac-2803]MWV50409.1 hypothetical protein [Rathayibacter sp. VKM Ac-2803]